MDSLKLVHRPPSLIDARDALEDALGLLHDVGELDDNDYAIALRSFWATFAHFGMGFGATTNGPSLVGVQESRQVPPRIP